MVSLTIPKAGYCGADVVDVIGRGIMRLVDTPRDGGIGTVSLETNRLSTGSYTLVLRCDDAVTVKSVIIGR